MPSRDIIIDSKICRDILEATEKKYSEKIRYASSDTLYHDVLNAVSRRKPVSLLVMKSPDLKTMIARAPGQSSDDFRMQIKTTSLTAEFLTELSSALERVGRKDLALISALKAHEYGEVSLSAIMRTSEMMRSFRLFSLNVYMLCRFANSLKPTPKLVLTLGDSLIELGEVSIGLNLYQYCAEECEIDTTKMKDLAAVASNNMLHESAAYWAQKALRQRPADSYAQQILATSRRYLCDWSDWAAETRLLKKTLASGSVLSIFSSLSYADNPRLHMIQSKRHRNLPNYAPTTPTPEPTGRPMGDRIRIGYFGADFHNHATMYLMSGLLREHDHKSFEIIIFSYGPKIDHEMRRAAESYADSFLDVFGWKDDEIASLAKEKGRVYPNKGT